ncbi:MAG: chemotaxis protein CheC [Lachnospiraceae bacterium]|nr:chemotaxis protein CheC [Lachnospiraceae bacterium]
MIENQDGGNPRIDNQMFLDVLSEIGNIGAGNATTALASMIDKRIDLSVPKSDFVGLSEISDIAGGAEEIVAGVYIEVNGEIDGVMMFIADIETARMLVNAVMMDSGKDREAHFPGFTDIELSALTEVGNIISGAYLTAISSLLGMTIKPTVPLLSIDMAGAILSVPAIEFGKQGDYALLIESQFNLQNISVNGYFVLIPSEDSYKNILKKLGIEG